jgi:hypothetical protein
MQVASSEVEISAAALPSAGPELWILTHAR